ncbi:MAG: hypothetical protein EOM83_13225 [Clostridia bacterium]|nr:hypothetical protein [Clostridia bacterium]
MENYYDHRSHRGIEIPRLFYDSLTHQPFARCQVCEKQLVETGASYMIEKVFRKNVVSGRIESQYEFAICFDCALKLTQSYSEESRANLQRFFNEEVADLINSPAAERPESERDVLELLSHCSITGKPVNELDEYQIAGHFNGGYLNTDMRPFMMGAGSMDDVSDLLSNKTLDEIDDFTGKFLTGPPEFRDFFKSPKRRPILV